MSVTDLRNYHIYAATQSFESKSQSDFEKEANKLGNKLTMGSKLGWKIIKQSYIPEIYNNSSMQGASRWVYSWNKNRIVDGLIDSEITVKWAGKYFEKFGKNGVLSAKFALLANEYKSEANQLAKNHPDESKKKFESGENYTNVSKIINGQWVLK